jgi:outer membrane immunogenic protein
VRKTLLASVSAMVLSSSVVMAADMAVKAKPVPPPLPSWTGFYAGLNAGYAWGDSDPSLTGDPTKQPLFFSGGTFGSPPGLRPSGFIGGGQAGYNLQNGQWLGGAEVDFDGLAAKADASVSPFFNGKGNRNTVSWSSRYDWLFTARLRGGFLVDPNWLVYVTGGLAVTHVHDSAMCTSPSNGVCGDSNAGSTISWSDSNTLAGGTVGGGVETKFAPHWTARVEYLYAKFKSTTAPVAGSTGFVPSFAAAIPPLFSFEHQLNMVRFAINYQFQ